MNYNTDITLWKNYRDSRLNARRAQSLDIWDGMVSDGRSVLARFSDQSSAIAAMKEAGWIITHKGAGLPHLASTHG